MRYHELIGLIDDVFAMEEEYGKQKYLPKYEKVVSIANYFDNSFTMFKDIEQIRNSYLQILEEIDSYRSSSDSNFSGKYMFDLDEIKVDFHFIEAGVSTIFVYKKNNSYYIEQPYNGIYQISGDEYNSIEKLVR